MSFKSYTEKELRVTPFLCISVLKKTGTSLYDFRPEKFV